MLDEANVVVTEYEYYNYLELKTAFISFMDRILEKMPYPLKISTEMDTYSILKYADLQIYMEEMLMPEKLICYLKLLQQVCRIKGVALVDICTYLDTDELCELLKAGRYSGLCFLLIETKDGIGTRECNTFIIDKDACIIHY